MFLSWVFYISKLIKEIIASFEPVNTNILIKLFKKNYTKFKQSFNGSRERT